MLKKIICFLMCAVMFPVSAAFAAEDDTQENIPFNERVEKLAYLGITFDEGIEHGASVTRAKFIRTVLDFVKAGIYNSDCGFYDVDEDHPYFDEINTGANLGYMIGYPDGYFYPEDTISVNDAVKVFVNALGYEVLAKQNGGYPMGYVSVADSIGLLKNVKTGDDGLTYDVFSVLLENALECNIYEMSFENGNPSYGENEEIDALWKFHRMIKVKAVVTANCITGLEDISGKTSDSRYAELNGETVFAGSSNVSEYLGYSVDAYVYYDEDEDLGEVKYVEPSTRNVSVTVDAEYILSDANEFSAYNFIYENSAGKVKNVKITQDTNIIYNGVAKADYKKEDLMPQIGNVTLIDNDSDGDVECISIFKAEQILIVDYASKDDDGIKIFDLKDSNNMYLYDDEYENYVVYVNGEVNLPSAIAKDMVALIGTNGEHSITYAFSNTLSGTITGISNKEDGSIEEVYIDDVEYKMAPGGENYQFKLGETGKFWVDDNFNVYGFQKQADTGNKYAYFISGYFDENELPIVAALKVLSSDNEIIRLNLSEKVKFNGSRKDAEEVMPELKKAGAGEENIWEPQVIMYELDEEGNVNTLFTAEDDGELRWEGRFYACRADSSLIPEEYKKPGETLTGGSFLDDDKKVFLGYNHGYDFYANSWQNYWYQDNETIYFNINESDLESSYVSGPLGNVARQDFVHDFYNVDPEKNTVDVVVWKRSTSSAQELPKLDNGINPAIVTSVTTVLDADDMPVKAIVCVQGGKTVSIPWNDKAPELVKQTFNSLHPGDIIYYELDGAAKLTNMYRAFDITKVHQYGMSMTSGEVHNNRETAVHLEKRSFYVMLTKKLQNDFFRYVGYDESSGAIQKMNTASEVYRMTVRNGKVKVETITYDDVKNGDEVFCKANTNTIYTMIVIDAD